MASITAALLAISSGNFVPSASVAEAADLHIGEPTRETALFNQVGTPESNEVQELGEALEANPSRGEGHGADDTAIFGYPRVAFETTAVALLDELVESAPNTFGGGALDPVEPLVYIGYVGDQAGLEGAINDREIAVEFIEMASTYSQRQAVGDHLRELGYDSSVGQFEEYVVMEISAEEIRAEGDDLVAAILNAVGASESRTTEVRDALFNAPDSGLAIGPLLVIPRAVEVVDYAL